MVSDVLCQMVRLKTEPKKTHFIAQNTFTSPKKILSTHFVSSVRNVMTNAVGPCRISTSAGVYRYFQTLGNKLEILGARKGTLNKFHRDNPGI